MNKDVFWFTHDANATDDEKIMLLIDQLGLEGYGIYWVLIEKLRSSDNFKLSFAIVPILARRYNTTTEKMMTVIKHYSLFQFDNENFFFSPSLIVRMQKWVDKREKNSIAGKISAQKRLALINNGQQTLNTCSTSVQLEQNRIEENKIEYNKENNIKEKKTVESVIEEQLLIDIPANEDYIKFRNWIKDNCPYCNNPKNFSASTISEKEFLKLKEKYTGVEIADVISEIENRKDLRRRYTNLYKTTLNWLKNRNDARK